MMPSSVSVLMLLAGRVWSCHAVCQSKFEPGRIEVQGTYVVDGLLVALAKAASKLAFASA